MHQPQASPTTTTTHRCCARGRGPALLHPGTARVRAAPPVEIPAPR
jgi:hypothetical protein